MADRKPIPELALAQHTAILGKTGSGKTSTAKLAVEQVVAENYRVCILDPIKSDWWGLTSNAAGTGPGLPFDILGGPHGHVPLHSSTGKAIGELVASGALAHSILDMADFEPGGRQRFFIDFATALLKSMRGVLYLVIEEAHEFAPKEKSGVGNENMATHWAKTLATAGRSKGIRLILATQRTQSLHNALLGSCETMIVHRMTAPADQEPVKGWLKANSEKDVRDQVASSLAGLKTGTGWICSGEAAIFELKQFPRIATYDNSATPTKDSTRREVKSAPVDQAKLRAIIGDAVKEAEANDPAKLKVEVARLRGLIDAAGKPTAADAETDRRWRADHEATLHHREAEIAYLRKKLEQIASGMRSTIDGIEHAVGNQTLPDGTPAMIHQFTPPALDTAPASEFRPPGRGIPPSLQKKIAKGAAPASAASTEDIPGPGRKILNSLATWAAMGHDAPSNAQVAWLADYSPNSSSYTNPRGALRSQRFIDYPSPDRLSLTTHGAACATARDIGGDLLAHVVNLLPGPEARILASVAKVFPHPLSNEEVAAGADYSAGSSSYTNPRGALKTKELITYPSPGYVRAADWLFSRASKR